MAHGKIRHGLRNPTFSRFISHDCPLRPRRRHAPDLNYSWARSRIHFWVGRRDPLFPDFYTFILHKFQERKCKLEGELLKIHVREALTNLSRQAFTLPESRGKWTNEQKHVTVLTKPRHHLGGLGRECGVCWSSLHSSRRIESWFVPVFEASSFCGHKKTDRFGSVAQIFYQKIRTQSSDYRRQSQNAG
jgi:hypothetical protein